MQQVARHGRGIGDIPVPESVGRLPLLAEYVAVHQPCGDRGPSLTAVVPIGVDRGEVYSRLRSRDAEPEEVLHYLATDLRDASLVLQP